MSNLTGAGTCAGRTRRGEPCGGFAVIGSEYCFAHAPERAAERAAARRAGGRARQAPRAAAVPERVELRRVEDVQALLELAVTDLLAMPNGAHRNRLLIAAAGAALSAIERGAVLGEIGELVKRLQTEAAEPWHRRTAA